MSCPLALVPNVGIPELHVTVPRMNVEAPLVLRSATHDLTFPVPALRCQDSVALVATAMVMFVWVSEPITVVLASSSLNAFEPPAGSACPDVRSEEHTSELQSP